MSAKIGGRPELHLVVVGENDLVDVLAGSAEGGTKLDGGIVELIGEHTSGACTAMMTRLPRPPATGLRASLEEHRPAVADIVFLSLAPDVFESTPVSEVETALEDVIRQVKSWDAHVIILNACTIDPEVVISNYHGKNEGFAMRAHRLNLALMRLSIATGVSILDADRVIAEAGAAAVVEAPLRYTADGCRSILRESVRIIDEYGFFEHRPLIAQVGQAGS